MEDGNEQPRSRIGQHLSFLVVLALGFASGWILERSKPPHDPNNPNYGVYDDKDMIAFQDWSGSNAVAVPALLHERHYGMCFGRTPDGGSIICIRDIRDANSQWVPIYKYDLVFGRDNSDGGAIIAVREWGSTNGPWATALKYRIGYERDAKGDTIVKAGDWFRTNAPLIPIFSIPAHE
jgi:hypothetical protein